MFNGFTKTMLLLFLLVSVSFADGITGNAAGYGQFPVYVYGDIEFFRQAFLIASMLNSSGLTEKFMTVGMLALIVGAAISAMHNAEWGGLIKKYAFMMTVLGAALYGKGTVYVVDMRVNYNAALYPAQTLSTLPVGSLNQGSFAAIDNVPWGLCMFAWASNAIGVASTGVIESVTTPVGDTDAKYLAYSSTGFNGQMLSAVKIMEKVGLNKGDDAEYQDAFSTYFEKCVMTNYATMNKASVLTNISSVGSIIDNINYTNFGSDGSEIIGADGKTCADYYAIINDGAKKDAVSNAIQAKMNGGDMNISVLGPSLMNKFLMAPGSPTTFNDTVLNLAANKYISKALSNSASGTPMSNAQELSADFSMSNVQNIGLGIGYFLGKVTPLTINFILAVIYAVFPLMTVTVMFIGLQNGVKLVINYFVGLLSLDLLNPSLSLVQGLSNYFLHHQLVNEYLNTATNPIAYGHISDYHYDLVSQAGVAGAIAAVVVFMVPGVILYGNTKALAAASSALQSYYRSSVDAQKQLADTLGTGGTVNRTAAQQNLLDAINSSQSTRGMMDSFVSNPDAFTSGAKAGGLQRGMAQVGVGNAANQLGYENVGTSSAINTQLSTSQSVMTANALKESGMTSGASIDAQLLKGFMNQAAQNFGQTHGFGTASTADAFGAGNLAGMSAANTATYNAGINADASKRADYLKGVSTQAAKSAGALIGAGRTKTVAQAEKEAIVQSVEAEFKSATEWANKSDASGEGLSFTAANTIASQTAGQIRSAQASVAKADKNYKGGYVAASEKQGAMQGLSLAGAAKGYDRLGRGADTMLVNQSQLGVETSAHQAAGTIRGAGGLHSAAVLAGNQAQVQSSVSSKMMGKFGVGGLVSAGFASQAASTQGTLNAIGAVGMDGFIASQAYQAEKKAIDAYEGMHQDEGQGLAKNGHVSGLGRQGIANDAISKSVGQLKSASLNNRASSALKSMFDGIKDPAGLQQTQAAYGLTDQDMKDIQGGKGLSSAALANFMKNNEKKLEQFNLSAFDGTGRVATAHLNQIATGTNADGSMKYASSIGTMSSFQSIQSGKKQDDHVADSVGAQIKEGINSVGGYSALHAAEGIGVAAGLGWAGYKLDKAHNGGRVSGAIRSRVASAFGKPISNSIDDTGHNGNHHEPHNTQNNVSQHGTPPSGYSQRPSGLFVPESIAHSAQSASHSGVFSKIGSFFGRHIPGGAGVAIGTAVAAEQAMAGDKIGAGMTMASTAVASIPGIGTVGSLAIDATQGILQATGAMGKMNNALRPEAQKIVSQSETTHDLTKNLSDEFRQYKSSQFMNQWQQEKIQKEQTEKIEEMYEKLEEYRKHKK